VILCDRGAPGCTPGAPATARDPAAQAISLPKDPRQNEGTVQYSTVRYFQKCTVQCN